MLGEIHKGGSGMSIHGQRAVDQSCGKGAVQLGWAFPLAEHLHGYVQYFSGYGYTLIDYNDFQRVLGLGVRAAF